MSGSLIVWLIAIAAALVGLVAAPITVYFVFKAKHGDKPVPQAPALGGQWPQHGPPPQQPLSPPPPPGPYPGANGPQPPAAPYPGTQPYPGAQPHSAPYPGAQPPPPAPYPGHGPPDSPRPWHQRRADGSPRG